MVPSHRMSSIKTINFRTWRRSLLNLFPVFFELHKYNIYGVIQISYLKNKKSNIKDYDYFINIYVYKDFGEGKTYKITLYS